jgi:hypothetical protein
MEGEADVDLAPATAAPPAAVAVDLVDRTPVHNVSISEQQVKVSQTSDGSRTLGAYSPSSTMKGATVTGPVLT